jgi:hypothetical protein
MTNVLKKLLGVVIIGGTISILAYFLSIFIGIDFLIVLKYTAIVIGVALAAGAVLIFVAFLFTLGWMLIVGDL